MARSLTIFVVLVCVGLFVPTYPSWSQELRTEDRRETCVVVELFRERSSEAGEKAAGYVNKLHRDHSQIRMVDWIVDENPAAAARLKAIASHFKVEQPKLPCFYLQRKLVQGFVDEATTGRNLEELLTLHVYWREGCQRCAKGKQFLKTLLAKYPIYRVEYHEIITDPQSRQRFEALVQRERITTPVVPIFQMGGDVIIGFFDESTTGKKIEDLLTRGLGNCGPKARPQPSNPQGSWQLPSPWLAPQTALFGLLQPPPMSDEPLASPATLPDELPSIDPVAKSEESKEGIDIPWIGRIQVADLGLPLFTLTIGLIDGFNPCAMWVLLFLLSILVNLRDRAKILAVAGTFVVVSGMVYLAFMAAWLNVFLLIGYMRTAQIVLGILAIVIGIIHVKDFFAFKWGVSLSIPESAKPGIYARVREIVMAKYLWAAITGAMILAVLVNAVELLCSAGLPAMYTQILSIRELPWWQNYLYLFLYIVAYMLDDTIMVGMVVITLAKTKLQETGGRWLKLVSGAVILLLGVLMVFKPEWLV